MFEFRMTALTFGPSAFATALSSQLANDSGLGSVVVASLQAILHTIRDGKFVTQDVAVFVLLR